VPAPSAAQGKPRGMRPVAILQFCDRHEIRTGQLGTLPLMMNSGTRQCSHMEPHWLAYVNSPLADSAL
jgi:hypothetical protein